MRSSARSPRCQSPVPALRETMREPSPCCSASSRNTTSAMGERQMFPVQTKITRKGSGDVT